jgi:crotonobetainyl-CoA:carnitine CoA-transferase CaiB-like acyl-CoA transferase
MKEYTFSIGLMFFGMGHVIAGAGIGRDLALFGADVLNIWQPLDWELEIFYWTSHVGMRSSILDFHEQADLKTFNQLLNDADVFFSNRPRISGAVRPNSR